MMDHNSGAKMSATEDVQVKTEAASYTAVGQESRVDSVKTEAVTDTSVVQESRMGSICRFCLSRKLDLQPIFDGSTVLTRIKDIIQLEVSSDDGLPTNICQQCVFQLNTAHCFKQRCINSENKLRIYLAQLSEDEAVDNFMDMFPAADDDDDDESDSDPDFDIPLCEVIYTDPLASNDLAEGKNQQKKSAALENPAVSIIKTVKKKAKKAPSEADSTGNDALSDLNESGNNDDDDSNDNDGAKNDPESKSSSGQPFIPVPDKVISKKLLAAKRKKELKNLLVICEICGKLFKKNHLYYHRKLHSTERKFECSTCNKTFKMLSHLNRHVRLHKGERPFLCAFCGKSFIDSSNLRNHTRNHRQERNHACVTCGKAFARAETLTKHLRSHTGEKPFTCEVCHRLFPRKDSLIRHLKSHRGERPHKCDICERSFTQSYDLKLHLRKHAARQI